jgi:hypothetical protein
MRREFDLPITAVTGPATDNEVGQVYITGSLGLPAHNAQRDPAGLLAIVRAAINEWTERTDRTEKTERDSGLGVHSLSVLSVLSVFSVLSTS